jgi:fimbrial isopeptide formation D2 family protein
MGTFRHLWHAAAALACVLLPLAVPVAQAQTITNTASAEWTQAGGTFSAQSNTVAFDVVPRPAALETFVRASEAGQSLAFTPSRCGDVVLPVPGGIHGDTAIASIERTNSVRIGEQFFFRLSAPTANFDPSAIDSIEATLTTSSGDRETIRVYETAADSGIFIGAVPTTAIPPSPSQGDCRLSVSPGDQISIECRISGRTTPIAIGVMDVLADPFGLTFDSDEGTPVSGARVSLVDALTGAPAAVFADDGVTPWPSSVVSGEPITDGAGNVYPMLPGEYRFPLARLGQYKLLVEPPAPYAAPSKASVASIAGLTRPDGHPFIIDTSSFGAAFALTSPTPVRIDIPMDGPSAAVTVTKTVSKPTALPGDVLFYTVTARNQEARPKRFVTLVDTPSANLRFRPGSVRIAGRDAAASAVFTADGRSLTVQLGDLAAGAERTITYAMTVRADAAPGQALNHAVVTDARGLSATASAPVKIERDTLTGRMTLLGRVTDGGCAIDGPHEGIPGVRLVLEDGSFAITDNDGRYHFEGLTPGTHVVQAMTATLPKGGRFTDCARSTRSAGSATSRFVIGQGGSLVVADFSAQLPAGSNPRIVETPKVEGQQPIEATPAASEAATDRAAAGAETDWLALGDGPTDFLFPTIDHNPRAPAIRVVIRHRVGEKVELSIDGKPVDPIAFDGVRTAPTHAVSIWRGIALEGETTHLAARVLKPDGSLDVELSRDVHFSAAPARVELVPGQSHLTADGSTRPVLALRVLDRSGRPVHAGLTGEFRLSSPYESAEALDTMRTRTLSGLGRAAPRWMVKGDDGIALIELAPTMVSGKLHLEFTFGDGAQGGGQRREQQVDAWVVPGADQPWTLVGLAEGSAGARTVAENMERSGQFDSDLGKDARVAFYAKGRILGKFLLTVAYDSAKQKEDQELLGAIDPKAYYTVFADGSDRRFDAASRIKLYVRLESRAFTALFGDFDTGFDQTELARYQRVTTGAKGEVNFDGFHAQGFAAKVSSTHRRDEIQGGGITGPYRLSSRATIANSEIVTIEVRDRFRSELIVDRRELSRFVDYDIDLLSGTISFKEPILSRDGALNPQFIVVDYEIDPVNSAGGAMNAGLRADWTTGNLRLGATAITDKSETARTDLAAVDAKLKLGQNTEIRAEAALSRSQGANAQAWLFEAEHHDGNLDLLAYARSADQAFGLGQMNGAERGRRKVGGDARLNLSEAFALTASAWYDDSLVDETHREAGQFGATYRSSRTDGRVAISMMRDRLLDGSQANSTVLEGGVTRRQFDNKLELDAATSIALGKAESIDLPERHRLSARYAISPAVKLVGSYEIAKGEGLDARTARGGFELTPWDGAKVSTTLGQQDVVEYGKRSFAAFGLAQSLDLSKHVTVDATLDSNRTIGGFDATRLINQQHPASSGGNLGDSGGLAEDYTAVTLGATYRAGRWSATARSEWRDGDLADRKGLTLGAIRQLGEGSMVGSGFTWTRATAQDGAATEVFDGAIAAAHRPADSPFAFLAKLEFRSDSVVNAVAGDAGPAGQTALTVTGDAKSRRVIGSVSANWSPKGEADGQSVQRTEIGVFAAIRRNFDSYEGFDLAGTTLMAGLDLRIGLGDRIEIGAAASVRHAIADGATSFSIGPQIGLSPAKDVLLIVGYNITGYRDRDFSAARSTNKGLFASVRMKFDAESFGFLGLGQR